MGQRANLVLIENGEWQLFYDHWVANSLHYELLWGPSITVDYLRGMHKQEPDSWLDEIWCEGAALIDLDRKHLLWYVTEIAYCWHEIEALMALLRHQWQGWTIEWAWQGLVDVVRYLGLPDQLVIDPNWQQSKVPFRLNLEFDEDNATLASYKQNGEYRVGRIGNGFTSELTGDDLSESLALLQLTELVWPEFVDGPQIGIYLDCDTQTIYYWQNRVLSLAHERLAALWPSWNTIFLSDNALERHLALLPIEINLLQPDLVALQRELVRELSHSLERRIKIQIAEMAKRLESEGHTVYVNPDAYHSAASVRDGEKQAILHDLEARLPIE